MNMDYTKMNKHTLKSSEMNIKSLKFIEELKRTMKKDEIVLALKEALYCEVAFSKDLERIRLFCYALFHLTHRHHLDWLKEAMDEVGKDYENKKD